MSETMYAGSSGTVARTRYIAFFHTFLKPPKTVQEDNGRPDGDITRTCPGHQRLARASCCDIPNTVVEPWTGSRLKE